MGWMGGAAGAAGLGPPGRRLKSVGAAARAGDRVVMPALGSRVFMGPPAKSSQFDGNGLMATISESPREGLF